ncbi:toxin VasX [Aquimarina muelleri]|uniref:toxin VasX n=1 Tax=Aquimarina muelleri TaxID=279356 RepID=UPI003F686585
MFQKNPRQGKAPLVIYAPEEQAEHNCDLSYKEPYVFEQIHLDAAVIKTELHPPQGAVALENYSYQRTTIKDGYIYIFDEDNRDWHTEYEVSHFGNLTNITWDDPQNKNSDGTYKDTRIPVNRDLKRSTTYHVVPKKGTKIRVCFSPVQWSADYHNKVRISEQLRSEKMLLVDCTGIPKNSKNTLVDVQSCKDVLAHFEYDQNTEAMWLQQKLKEITDDEKQQKDDLYEDMFVTLHDPWRCADTICKGIDTEITYLKAIMVSLQTGKSPDAIFSYLQNNEQVPVENTKKHKQTQYLHRLAQLTYDFVYNDHENTEKYNTNLVKSIAANVALDLTIGEYLRPFIEKNGVEKSKLEKLLAVTERKKQRDSINTYRDDLGNFMKSDYYQDIAEDYLNSIADNIEDAKGIIAEHTIALGQYPNNYDRHLDLKTTYQPKNDTWHKIIKETLYNATPTLLAKSTQILDHKIALEDIITLSLTKKTVSNMRKILKAYADHGDFKGGYTALALHGKVSYIRNKHSREVSFKFRALKNFDEYLLENKKQLRLELGGKKISLKQYKKNWFIEYEKMTAKSAQAFIDEGKVKIELKNAPKKFENEIKNFYHSGALAGVLLIIESIFWAEAFHKWNKDSGIKNDVVLSGASIKLGAAITRLAEETKTYEKLFKKEIADEFKRYGKVLSVFSSAITIYSLGKSALTSYSYRDTDAAVAYGVATGLSGVFLAADISAVSASFGGTAFLTLGFWPAALLGGAIIASIYLINKYLKDTELEGYFKNFPLSDYALPPKPNELPYTYANRLLVNVSKTIQDTDKYQVFRDVEVAFVELADMLTPNHITTEVFLPKDQLQRAANKPYHTSLHYIDTRTLYATRFKVHLFAAHACSNDDDLEIKAWLYPNGIQPNAPKTEITTFFYDFPNPDPYSFSAKPLPSCSIDFALPLDARYEYNPANFGYEFHNAEILFMIRVVNDPDNNEYSPERLHNTDRYKCVCLSVKQAYTAAAAKSMSLFGANSHYVPQTSQKSLKTKQLTRQQAQYKRGIFSSKDIPQIQSYTQSNE